MFPNGPTGANQFMVGSAPNYGAGLMNFSQIGQPQQQQQQQRPGQPGQPQQQQPGNFAAALRQFFMPGNAPQGMGQPAGPMNIAPQQQAGAGFNPNGLY